MADFTAVFLDPGAPLFGLHDAEDYPAVFAPVLLDTARPVVTVVSPTPGTQIARNAPVIVDVTDDSGNVGAVLLARYPSFRILEGIWDGVDWGYLFAAGSSRQAISKGWRYTLRRDGGWPGAPTFLARGFDGNLDG